MSSSFSLSVDKQSNRVGGKKTGHFFFHLAFFTVTNEQLDVKENVLYFFSYFQRAEVFYVFI